MTFPKTVIRRAAVEDIDPLSRVVADTLMAQPTAAWLVPDAAERTGVLLGYARLLLMRGLNEGQVVATNDQAAVSVWYSRLEPPAPAASWVYDLQRILGSHAPRFALLHAYADAVVPHTPHHYLAHFGARTGQCGAAHAVLSSYHRELELPAYAEVSGACPRESMIARLGYEPRSPVLLEPGGPVLWRMWWTSSGDRGPDGLPCRVRAHRFAMPVCRRVVPAASPRSP
ncbi:N-acetyltransferase [Micromonospora sp. NPDC047527]|uniref:N-acetyltransferase n=1 Tax=Micromonospora sp. NPDC047527 TaxID=3155144 RepID=UPI0033F8B29B